MVLKARDLLQRIIKERTRGSFAKKTDQPTVIILDIGHVIGKESFRIQDESDASIRITGHDERGLVYGVGKLLHNSHFEKGTFIPGSWRGTSMSQKKLEDCILQPIFITGIMLPLLKR